MGREAYSKPLPGSQERTIGAFQKHLVCGPDGGETGIHTFTAGDGGSTTNQHDTIACEQGNPGDVATVNISATPRAVTSGRIICYAGVRLSRSISDWTGSITQVGWAVRDHTSLNSEALFSIVSGGVRFRMAESVTDPATDVAVDTSGTDLTTITHISVEVDYDASETSGYLNSNPFIDDPTVSVDASGSTSGVPNSVKGVTAGIRSGGIGNVDADEAIEVAYLGYIYVP